VTKARGQIGGSLGEQLGAEAKEAAFSGTRALMRASQYFGAEHGVDPSSRWPSIYLFSILSIFRC
jgi:hypothetical protein